MRESTYEIRTPVLDVSTIISLACCEQMQGYLISRPVPRDAITAMLRTKEASPTA